MDTAAARELLGVPPNATSTDIDDAFRRLASSAHPDRGGDHDAMANLLQAREVLLARSASTALVPLETARELARLALEQARVALTVDARVGEAKREIQMRSTNRMRALRMVLAIAATVFGAVVFLAKDINDRLPFINDELEVLAEETPKLLRSFEDASEQIKWQSRSLLQFEEEILKTSKTDSTELTNKRMRDLKESIKFYKEETSRLLRIFSRGQMEYDDLIGTPKVKPSNEPPKKRADADANANADTAQAIATVQQDLALSKEYLELTRWRAERRMVELKEKRALHVRLIQRTLFIAACVSGFIAGACTLLIQRSELLFLEIEQQMSTKTLANKMIRSIFDKSFPSEWTIEDFARSVKTWAERQDCKYKPLMLTAGSFYLAQFIVGKAIQVGLLTVDEKFKEGEFNEIYSMKAFGTSNLKPQS
ncbi:Small T antigen [Variovorax sp. PBL-H6]|uniref:J domain-containing protein n=1 Tax=Variovorax sp. PBL-H6 TaxID=434009 RepID=UPI001315B68D|nr:J domain-containing protein [Variovorax sp. PBL-H6]VTU30589.1 Small T antigen [Variovorax sp. PBL-H6]